ncbi:hypothetical protein D9619_011848 [Psilocybe cf. subviscida]|uniref:Uncharacterized protein n=1 Tax=Psilocybe cf. subviscida TaxID=2480587 RepID=A0A8H5EVN4_9AGAR|nr:hypothetical protein D9619_011848 [Psilocybe cf. subviscida]
MTKRTRATVKLQVNRFVIFFFPEQSGVHGWSEDKFVVLSIYQVKITRLLWRDVVSVVNRPIPTTADSFDDSSFELNPLVHNPNLLLDCQSVPDRLELDAICHIHNDVLSTDRSLRGTRGPRDNTRDLCQAQTFPQEAHRRNLARGNEMRRARHGQRSRNPGDDRPSVR